MMKFIKIISVFILFIFSSCDKINNNPVPFVLTDINININFPSYSGLISVGGFAYVQGGNKGIIVYRKGLNDFVAYDRMFPSNDGANCKPVIFDTNSGIKILSQCNDSEFSIIDGSVLKGNSKFPLRPYLTSFNGVNSLRIYN